MDLCKCRLFGQARNGSTKLGILLLLLLYVLLGGSSLFEALTAFSGCLLPGRSLEGSPLSTVKHATMHRAHYVVCEHVQDPSKLLLCATTASHLHLAGAVNTSDSPYTHHMHVTHTMHSMGSMFAKHVEHHIVSTFTMLSMQD